MKLKDFDIVIEPREIIFEHIQPNKKFTKTINIKNVGNKSKRMELFRPGNKVFKLDFTNPELPVPPGMEIAAKINFETTNSQDYVDKMIVCIDNNEIEIPIQAFPAKPILKIDEKVDFGTQSANNKTISVNLKISNIGAVDGEFSVIYKGNLPITFTPAKDILPAYSDSFIRVDFFTKYAMKVEEKAEIILRGSDKPLSFKIIANVMEKQLILLDSDKNQPINRIDFGSCYYGCNLTNLAILFNSSPEKVDYVILLEENGVGAEIGAEFSKSTKALKATNNDFKEEDFCPLSKLITAFPNNGTLEPFEKRPIFFRFSPECISPKLGFSTTLKPPQRRDYAIFVFLEQVGSHKKSEIAITGTALPVLLRAEQTQLEFGVCEIGQKKELITSLHNDSELKSVKFKFRKVANYIVNPASGLIQPRQHKKIKISFVPNQIGSFKYTLGCEVIDKLIDKHNPLVVLDRGITEIPLQLLGNAVELKKVTIPKYSGGPLPKNFVPGTDPVLSNEVGLNVNTTVDSLKPFVPKAAVQNAVNDHLHKVTYSEKIKSGKAGEYRIAFPNDRSKSIGPFDKKEKYKTLFTGIDRYNYVDPDYAYTDKEQESLERHKMIYKRYLDSLKYHRTEKLRNSEYHAYNDPLNIGLKPACGLKPQHLSINELIKEANKRPDFESNNDWKLISSDDLVSQQKKFQSCKENATRLNSISSRDKEKLNVQLTPAQIYKIIVDPSVIDFGEVCIKSVSTKTLEILNTLDQPIHVELENDCNELRQTTPLSQIIQPQSKGVFSIIFESEYVQTFQRSISYRINYSYRHHIIVLAECKLQSLKLSKPHAVLNQLLDVQPDICYRTNITVINPYNSTTEFTWMPIYGEQGTAFSIRPASGIIEPFKDIDCEIVWHGSYLAPLTGTFSLLVTGGESATLTCEAKLGTPQLQFISRRAQFGKIPVNMPSVKTFYITNTGSHNAFFQILDPKPIQGMTITPTFGMAPLNTLTPIKVEINPSEILKFDARIMVQVRGSKNLELRFGGESEEPMIDINIPQFEFGGVFSGATCKIPFKLVNTSSVKGKVEFNLKKYSDYSVKCSDPLVNFKESGKVYDLIIPPEKVVDLELVFCPTEIASYDFDLPIIINRPTSAGLYSSYDQLTPYPASEFMDSTNIKTPPTRSTTSRHSLAAFTPKRRITAIGLRNAIKLTETKINFKIPIMYFEKLKEGGFYEAKSTIMSNHSNRNIKWCLDMRNSNQVTEQGIFKICNGSMVPFCNPDGKSFGPEGDIKPNETFEFKILFCPDKPGTYHCKIPIVVNDNYEQPYYTIEIFGELLTPEIKFDPEVLTLKPVPLGIETVEKFFIKHTGYENKTKLTLKISNVKALDGEPLNPLSVRFINDPVILPQVANSQIECEVKFMSAKPISTTIKLTLTDEQNREYVYRVIITADNSLFTCYAFLADHLYDFHIVLEEGHIMKGSRTAVLPSEMSGEPILRPYSDASKYSQTNAGSPTFDIHTSQSVQSRMKDIDADMRAAINNNEEAATPYLSQGGESRMSTVFTKGQEPLLFPSNETNSGVFAYEILKILQRWFRCNGWPNSLNLVKIPDSFRGCVSRKPFDENQEKIPQQDAVKRENKTIYEMIGHLCGRPLPAIPVGALVPANLNERTTQFHWQHNVLLKFLENEGGCVSHIKPEHLLDTHEFKSWLEQNEKLLEMEETIGYKTIERKSLESADIPINLFQLVSRKAWLDLLLQLLKISVLNRITPKSLKMKEVPYNEKATFPFVKADPLISNIYSIGERVLLTWLNYCYANYKDKIWTSNDRGGVPSTRWIVNFDIDLTDSLTLAAVIGAYCPFIIETHLKRMYVMADTAEKCFHNALILIDSIRELGLDYDINSLDITDPNPIAMILFCAFLYDKLPNYVPSATIEFSSPLHQTVNKKIKISNPNIKNIFYIASIIGPNAQNFSLPNGNQISLGPKASTDLVVNYVGNNLKSATAYLLLNGKKNASLVADTLVFNLNANIDELSPVRIVKFNSLLYDPIELEIEIENPYDQSGEFKVTLIESQTRNGIIKNPFNPNNTNKTDYLDSFGDFKLPLIEKTVGSPFKQNSKSSFENLKNKMSQEKIKEDQEPKPHLSAFNIRVQSIKFEPKEKQKILVTYLPLQLVKHCAIILFTNDKLGEFLYNLEGVAQMPEKCKIIVDEAALDSRVKLIKSNRSDNFANLFRCFAGDKVEIKFLLPVCNLERESALILAAEMRMSELELKRRKLHGALSSKSLLEALEKLTLNKEQIDAFKEKNKKLSSKKNTKPSNTINYMIQSKNNVQFQAPSYLKILEEDLRSDENLLPLSIKFSADRPGTFSTSIDLFADLDDIRTIPIEFKVAENSISDSSIAYLQFNTSVFDSTNQQIPIKNNSDMTCNYEVEIVPHRCDVDVFTGPKKFSIRQKENFLYDLTFAPVAEEKYQAELRFNNVTEGTQIKYLLTGIAERCPPLGEIKFESKVGHKTQHEILIPNRSNKKICFYISSSSGLVNGPNKIMILPNKKELYKFEILPTQRGEYKGTVTFKPGEWPIKDIDSDGEEIVPFEEVERPQRFTLWFTFDLKVQPPEAQSVVDIKTNSMESYTLIIPLLNPFDEAIKLIIKINGPYLQGESLIEIKPKDKYKYVLEFKPIQVGKYRGNLIFYNEIYGEFWYDLKLTSLDPLPIQLEPIKAEVGRFAIETIKIKNPLNENLQFKTILSMSNYFSLERRQSDSININANESSDVNLIFIPAAVGFSDHYAKISFLNEKLGNITYELSGLGLEPDLQDPINITSEIGQSQIVTINFRNSTDSAIYCDITLRDENFEPLIVNNMVNKTPEPNQIFNILLESLQNLHLSPRSILEIPVMFCPTEMKKYNVNLVVLAKREAQMSWLEPESKQQKKIEKLKWVYPIKAFTVINAINKASPFVLECMVRKRLEKRMEVIISDVSSYSSGLDKSALKLRSVTPQDTNKPSLENLIIIGDVNNLATEFMHSIQFNGSVEQSEIAKNSIAMKLIRSQREKNTGLLTLVFDFIFCPSQSFLTEAYLQIETALGGMWRYPIKLIAIEPPPDDIIQIEVTRLNREFSVGFKLSSKIDKSIPFKAEFISPGENYFTVYPKSGELLPDSEDGTLFKVGFTSPSYGKIYQTQLLITTPIYQWKYLVKGVTSDYVVPRGHSAIPRIGSNSDPRLKRIGKKKNYIVENTYIIQTAVSSPIKGASLVPMKYSNKI